MVPSKYNRKTSNEIFLRRGSLPLERLNHCNYTNNFYKTSDYGRKNPLPAAQEEVVRDDRERRVYGDQQRVFLDWTSREHDKKLAEKQTLISQFVDERLSEVVNDRQLNDIANIQISFYKPSDYGRRNRRKLIKEELEKIRR